MMNKRKIIPIIVVISIVGAIASSVAAAGLLTFGTMTITPTEPAALSTITISILINGEVPSEVRVTVEECNGNTGVCYPDIQNVSMSLSSPGNYEAEVTLKHADTTYITCQVFAKIGGAWESSAKKNIDLSESPNGNNGEDNTTPGFEAVVFVIAIGISLILISRSRVK